MQLFSQSGCANETYLSTPLLIPDSSKSLGISVIVEQIMWLDRTFGKKIYIKNRALLHFLNNATKSKKHLHFVLKQLF